MAGWVLFGACTKEEPTLGATLHARCQGCIVSRAAGVQQSRQDTLVGVIDPGTGDTLPEERQWTVLLKDGDNLFFRACHTDTNPAGHGMELWVDGDVQPLQAATDTAACTEINRAVRKR